MRFGILGEAKIAREWLVPAIIESGHEVTHLGRRNPGQESLPEIYQDVIETDYEGLLAEPSIDATSDFSISWVVTKILNEIQSKIISL